MTRLTAEPIQIAGLCQQTNTIRQKITELLFYIQWFVYVRATCFDRVGHLQALQENRSKSCYIILNSVHQHNQFITQGNNKATCFDYRLVIFRPIFVI